MAVPVIEEEVIVRAQDQSIATVAVLVLGIGTLVFGAWSTTPGDFLSMALGIMWCVAGGVATLVTLGRLLVPRPPWQMVGKPGRLAWGRIGGEWTEVNLADIQRATLDGLSEETSIIMTLRDGTVITIPGDQIPAERFEAVAYFLRAHSDGEIQVVGKP